MSKSKEFNYQDLLNALLAIALVFNNREEKEPLYITEDGYKVFKEDETFLYMYQKNHPLIKKKAKNIKSRGTHKVFYCEKLAQEYLEMNETQFSIEDIDKYMHFYYGVYNKSTLITFGRNKKEKYEKISQFST